MLPPLDDQIIRENPDFANLYNKLITTVLNPDGSTKEDPAAKEHTATRERLDQRRFEAAKQHLLTRAIASANPSKETTPASNGRSQPSQTLPDSLLDLLVILPPLLDPEQSLPSDSISLLFSSPPLSDLDSLLPDLCNLVSSNLRTSALGLARISHPSTNPSYLHRHIASLSDFHASLQARLGSANDSLTTSRREVLTALVELLSVHTSALTLLIRTLEAKHGPVSRNLELRASEVSLSAQRVTVDAAQTLHNLRQEVYSPEAVTALRNYAHHLQDAKTRGIERIRGLEAELGEYGVGVQGGESKERMMREMARVYSDMAQQMRDVRGDVDRLQGT